MKSEDATRHPPQKVREQLPYEAGTPELLLHKTETEINRPVPLRQRVIVTRENEEITTKRSHYSFDRDANEPNVSRRSDSQPVPIHEKNHHGNARPEDAVSRSRDMERQLIVRELQRQRVLAISGHTPKPASGAHKHMVPSSDAPPEPQHTPPDKSTIIRKVESLNPDGETDGISRTKRVLVSRKNTNKPRIEKAEDKPVGESQLSDRSGRNPRRREYSRESGKE